MRFYPCRAVDGDGGDVKVVERVLLVVAVAALLVMASVVAPLWALMLP